MADETEPKQPDPRADKKTKDDGLVTMSRGGEQLRVHPDHVNEHARLGWKQG